MSNSINVTRQLLTTAPYSESTNATLLKNVVSVQINGSSTTTQTLLPSQLVEVDFSDTVQAQTQTGSFVSLTDKEYYPIDTYETEENGIKDIETDFGVAYDYLSNTSADMKYQRVLEDVKVKNTVINNPEWGTQAYIAHVQQIEADIVRYRQTRNQRLGSGQSITKISNTNRSYDNSNYGKTPDIPFYVRITEDQKDTYEALSAKGSFGNDPVVINVFQNVVNFSFDTTQSFNEVVPRGAQTPMRYYEKNNPRSLSFTTEFHQQEFPLEPLLTIAEKAQYLARPYRHGDYSLIPKLVRVEIPGRVFRGYVMSAAVTYSGEDYRQWTQESVRAGLYGSQGKMASLGGYVQYDIDYNPQNTGIQNGQYNQTQDKMDYGLSKLNIDFRIAIVEEVRLTVYQTLEEQREAEALEQAQAEKEALQLDWENAVGAVEAQLGSMGLLEGNNPEELVYVDKVTGEVVGLGYTLDEQGNIVYIDPPEGAVTLEQFKRQEEVRESNKQNPNADLFYKDSNTVLELLSLETTSKDQLINDILTVQRSTGKLESPVYTKEELDSKSVEELKQIREQQIKEINGELSDLLDFTNRFDVLETDKEDNQNLVSYLTSFPKLKDLLVLPINTLDDCKTFLDKVDYSNKMNAGAALCYNKNRKGQTISEFKLQKIMNIRPNTQEKGRGIVEKTISNYGLVELESAQNRSNIAVDFTRVSNDVLSETARNVMIDNGRSPFSLQDIRFDKDVRNKLVFYNTGTTVENDSIINFMVDLFKSIQSSLPKAIDTYIGSFVESPPTSKFYPTREVGLSRYEGDGCSYYYYLTLDSFK